MTAAVMRMNVTVAAGRVHPVVSLASPGNHVAVGAPVTPDEARRWSRVLAHAALEAEQQHRKKARS